MFQKEEPFLCPTRSRSQRTSLLYALWLVWPLEAKCFWPVSLAAVESYKAGPIRSLCTFISGSACMQPRQTGRVQKGRLLCEGNICSSAGASQERGGGTIPAGFALRLPPQQRPQLHLPNGILWCQGWAPCHSSLQEHLSLAGCQAQSSLWPLGIS